VPGVSYNLYEYELPSVQGVGSAAALPVPVRNFNANRRLATYNTPFTAVAASFEQTITTTSDKIIVFRCVPASAP
jgi:hypothetical protein